MSKQHMISRAVAYRWLAQFFLCPPDLTTLESYHSQEGGQFLSELQSDPALAPLAGWLQGAVADQGNIAPLQGQIARAFTQAFDMGGPRAALPYASVYLSESGLLFQQPTRDMLELLQKLQMQLPADINEPPDHIGVQLHVAAELVEREERAQPVPLSSSEFLNQHVLTWLPELAQRCAKLPAQNPVRMFVDATLNVLKTHNETADLCRKPM